MKRRRSISPITGGPSASAHDSESQNSSRNALSLAAIAPPVQRVRTPADKFDAFGNFIVSSLTDMPEKKALELVEKFTSEIVKALLSKEATE